MLSSSDITLVTGATGFVGAAVARNLARKGHRLRLLARPGSDRRNLAGLHAELVEGDLAAPESLPPAVAGCRYLYHVAADYRLWVPDAAAMRRVNIDGTLALLRAAAAAGVERSVYTSSVAALGLTLDGSPADETTPVTPAHLVGAYKRSKYDAEQAVRQLAATQDIVIVNPSTPVGPGDVKPTPTGKMVLDAANGKMPAFVDTGLNIVHVDDVAEGHVLAMEKGRVGEAYILGGDDLMLGQFFAMIAGQAGRKPPAIRLPIAPLVPLAWVLERIAGITGKPR
jgi:dihydroflavonol-4-reductase